MRAPPRITCAWHEFARTHIVVRETGFTLQINEAVVSRSVEGYVPQHAAHNVRPDLLVLSIQAHQFEFSPHTLYMGLVMADDDDHMDMCVCVRACVL
jgi:hypothetical protein